MLGQMMQARVLHWQAQCARRKGGPTRRAGHQSIRHQRHPTRRSSRRPRTQSAQPACRRPHLRARRLPSLRQPDGRASAQPTYRRPHLRAPGLQRLRQPGGRGSAQPTCRRPRLHVRHPPSLRQPDGRARAQPACRRPHQPGERCSPAQTGPPSHRQARWRPHPSPPSPSRWLPPPRSTGRWCQAGLMQTLAHRAVGRDQPPPPPPASLASPHPSTCQLRRVTGEVVAMLHCPARSPPPLLVSGKPHAREERRARKPQRRATRGLPPLLRAARARPGRPSSFAPPRRRAGTPWATRHRRAGCPPLQRPPAKPS
jgi:hypothetical protein